MNLDLLQSATWQYRKRVAQLISNGSPIITIDFRGRITEVHFENRVLHIRRSGFCKPTINIEENGNILFAQRSVSIWGNRHEAIIENRKYLCTAKLRMNYHVVYSDISGNEIVAYHQNSWRWNPPVAVQINRRVIPEGDLLLLIIAGYFTLRKLKQDSDAAAVASIAVVSG